MRKWLKFIYNFVFYTFIAVVIMFSIISFKADDYKGIKKIGDFAFCNVLTGSMSPTINPGSLIVVKEIDQNSIKVDDIVTMVTEGTSSVVTHRIVEINNNEYVTKGDANDTNDSFYVNYDMIVGKVILTMPAVGKVMSFIQENIYFVLGGIVLILMLTEVLKRLRIETKVSVNE